MLCDFVWKVRIGEAFRSHDTVLLLFAASCDIWFIFIDFLLSTYQYLQALNRYLK